MCRRGPVQLGFAVSAPHIVAHPKATIVPTNETYRKTYRKTILEGFRSGDLDPGRTRARKFASL